jgi:TRAP-type transport system periplasmic protein
VSRLFKEELEKASPDGHVRAGEIRVVLYDQGMVGTERQLLENAYFGAMEVVQVNSAVGTTIDPAYSLFDLPYLFVSDEHHGAVLNGEIGELFLGRLRARNLLGLGFYGLGFRNMFNKAPCAGCVRTPDGLRGLKLRVIESPIMIAAINALGASATPVPFSELFQALRTGVVDGVDNGARVFTSSRYYETGTDCFTLTEHFTNQHVLIANDEWFQSLEPRYRQRILEVARGIGPRFERIWESATEEALREMESYGVTVNQVDDKEAFMARVGVSELVPNLLRFLAVMLAVQLLITYVPFVTTALPSLM